MSDIERAWAARTTISFDSEETKRFVIEFLRDFIKNEHQESKVQEGTIWGDPSIVKQIREAKGDGDTRSAQDRFAESIKSQTGTPLICMRCGQIIAGERVVSYNLLFHPECVGTRTA